MTETSTRAWRAILPVLLASHVACSIAHSAEASRVPYGMTKDGEAIEAITLTNRRGVRVRILTYGGIINEVVVPDLDGRCENVALALPDLQAYENRANFSSLLGRYANRISGGGFVLDGQRYDLAGASDITSHGGSGGYGARRWSAAEFQTADVAGVVLHDLSFDGENGFPGNVSMQVTFTLTSDNTLRIDYLGSTDRPTVLNPSHHVYFNLAGSDTIYEHRLQVFASRYTPIDARKLPTGSVESVEGTAMDLRQAARLADRVDADDPQIRVAGGFDHNFVLDKPEPGAMTRAARVEEPASRRVLQVYTTEPGVQVFTANGFNGSLQDARGRPLQRGAGLALETQHFPDSPNHPNFPSTVLRPGQTFHSMTEYRFLVTTPGGVAPGSCSR